MGDAHLHCGVLYAFSEKSQRTNCEQSFRGCPADSNCHSAYRLRSSRGDACYAQRSLAQIGIGSSICQKLKRKKERRKTSPFFFGAAGQIRTADLILTKDALYLLSYSSKFNAPCGEGALATTMGLEPTTSGVTGRRSNQLNYMAN